MIERSSAVRLLRALQRLLPEASFGILSERPWHSLTFSGHQMCISARLNGPPAENVQRFTKGLPNHEFCLPGQLVADIAVTERCFVAGEHSLMIEALVLDD